MIVLEKQITALRNVADQLIIIKSDVGKDHYEESDKFEQEFQALVHTLQQNQEGNDCFGKTNHYHERHSRSINHHQIGCRQGSLSRVCQVQTRGTTPYFFRHNPRAERGKSGKKTKPVRGQQSVPQLPVLALKSDRLSFSMMTADLQIWKEANRAYHKLGL